MATSLQDLQNLVNSQGDQVQQAIAGQKNGYNALLDRQQQQQQGLFDQYTQAVNNQPKLTDIFSNLQNQYGIPDAQKQLLGYKDQTYRVQGLLNNLVPDIANRTQGTLTTQAMRDRMAAAEGTKLNTQIQSLGTAMQPLADVISSGNQQINTLLPLYEQQQQKELQPLTLEINSLGDRFAREISGYNTSSQNELNAILDKFNKQFSLSEADWQNAQKLAAQEAQYKQYLSSLAPPSTSTPTTPNIPTLPQTYIGNNDLRGRLNYLAQQGDQNAKTALQYVGNDGKYSLSPYVANPSVINALNSFGFTNVYKPPVTTPYTNPSPFVRALVGGRL